MDERAVLTIDVLPRFDGLKRLDREINRKRAVSFDVKPMDQEAKAAADSAAKIADKTLSGIDLPPIVPRVDHKPLYDLNTHLSEKESHYARVLKVFSQPIRPNIALSDIRGQIDTLVSKEIDVRVNLRTKQLELGAKGSFYSRMERSITSAIKRGNKKGLIGRALDVLTSPLRAAADEFSRSAGKAVFRGTGFQQGYERVGQTIGSVGTRVGRGYADSFARNIMDLDGVDQLFEGIQKGVEKFGDTIGIDNVSRAWDDFSRSTSKYAKTAIRGEGVTTALTDAMADLIEKMTVGYGNLTAPLGGQIDPVKLARKATARAPISQTLEDNELAAVNAYRMRQGRETLDKEDTEQLKAEIKANSQEIAQQAYEPIAKMANSPGFKALGRMMQIITKPVRIGGMEAALEDAKENIDELTEFLNAQADSLSKNQVNTIFAQGFADDSDAWAELLKGILPGSSIVAPRNTGYAEGASMEGRPTTRMAQFLKRFQSVGEEGVTNFSNLIAVIEKLSFFTTGYSESLVQLLAVYLRLKEINPQADLQGIGFSLGAEKLKELGVALKQLGLDEINTVGLGYSESLGGARLQNELSDLNKTITSLDDLFGENMLRAISPENLPKGEQLVPGLGVPSGAQHTIENYVSRDDVIQILGQYLKGVVPSEMMGNAAHTPRRRQKEVSTDIKRFLGDNPGLVGANQDLMTMLKQFFSGEDVNTEYISGIAEFAEEVGALDLGVIAETLLQQAQAIEATAPKTDYGRFLKQANAEAFQVVVDTFNEFLLESARGFASAEIKTPEDLENFSTEVQDFGEFIQEIIEGLESGDIDSDNISDLLADVNDGLKESTYIKGAFLQLRNNLDVFAQGFDDVNDTITGLENIVPGTESYAQQDDGTVRTAEFLRTFQQKILDIYSRNFDSVQADAGGQLALPLDEAPSGGRAFSQLPADAIFEQLNLGELTKTNKTSERIAELRKNIAERLDVRVEDLKSMSLKEIREALQEKVAEISNQLEGAVDNVKRISTTPLNLLESLESKAIGGSAALGESKLQMQEGVKKTFSNMFKRLFGRTGQDFDAELDAIVKEAMQHLRESLGQQEFNRLADMTGGIDELTAKVREYFRQAAARAKDTSTGEGAAALEGGAPRLQGSEGITAGLAVANQSLTNFSGGLDALADKMNAMGADMKAQAEAAAVFSRMQSNVRFLRQQGRRTETPGVLRQQGADTGEVMELLRGKYNQSLMDNDELEKLAKLIKPGVGSREIRKVGGGRGKDALVNFIAAQNASVEDILQAMEVVINQTEGAKGVQGSQKSSNNQARRQLELASKQIKEFNKLKKLVVVEMGRSLNDPEFDEYLALLESTRRELATTIAGDPNISGALRKSLGAMQTNLTTAMRSVPQGETRAANTIANQSASLGPVPLDIEGVDAELAGEETAKSFEEGIQNRQGNIQRQFEESLENISEEMDFQVDAKTQAKRRAGHHPMAHASRTEMGRLDGVVNELKKIVAKESGFPEDALDDVRVLAVELEKLGFKGAYDASRHDVYLNAPHVASAKQGISRHNTMETIIHELRHAIQKLAKDLGQPLKFSKPRNAEEAAWVEQAAEKSSSMKRGEPKAVYDASMMRERDAYAFQKRVGEAYKEQLKQMAPPPVKGEQALLSKVMTQYNDILKNKDSVTDADISNATKELVKDFYALGATSEEFLNDFNTWISRITQFSPDELGGERQAQAVFAVTSKRQRSMRQSGPLDYSYSDNSLNNIPDDFYQDMAKALDVKASPNESLEDFKSRIFELQDALTDLERIAENAGFDKGVVDAIEAFNTLQGYLNFTNAEYAKFLRNLSSEDAETPLENTQDALKEIANTIDKFPTIPDPWDDVAEGAARYASSVQDVGDALETAASGAGGDSGNGNDNLGSSGADEPQRPRRDDLSQFSAYGRNRIEMPFEKGLSKEELAKYKTRVGRFFAELRQRTVLGAQGLTDALEDLFTVDEEDLQEFVDKTENVVTGAKEILGEVAGGLGDVFGPGVNAAIGTIGKLNNILGITKKLGFALTAALGLGLAVVITPLALVSEQTRLWNQRLKAVGASSDELERLRGIARNTGQDIGGLVEGSFALRGALTGIADDAEIDKMTEQLANISQGFGLTNDAAERFRVAVQQMASKGVISMEELRQQAAEAVPQSIRAAADAAGVDVSQLEQAGREGRLRSDTVLPKFLSNLEREAEVGKEEAMTALPANLNRIGNSLQELGSAIGQIPLAILNGLLGALAKLGEISRPLIPVITTLIGAFVIHGLAATVQTLWAIAGGFSGIMIKAAGAAKAVKALLTLMLSPKFIAFAAIAATIGIAWRFFTDSMDDARTPLKQLQKTIDETNKALDDLRNNSGVEVEIKARSTPAERLRYAQRRLKQLDSGEISDPSGLERRKAEATEREAIRGVEQDFGVGGGFERRDFYNFARDAAEQANAILSKITVSTMDGLKLKPELDSGELVEDVLDLENQIKTLRTQKILAKADGDIASVKSIQKEIDVLQKKLDDAGLKAFGIKGGEAELKQTLTSLENTKKALEDKGGDLLANVEYQNVLTAIDNVQELIQYVEILKRTRAITIPVATERGKFEDNLASIEADLAESQTRILQQRAQFSESTQKFAVKEAEAEERSVKQRLAAQTEYINGLRTQLKASENLGAIEAILEVDIDSAGFEEIETALARVEVNPMLEGYDKELQVLKDLKSAERERVQQQVEVARATNQTAQANLQLLASLRKLLDINQKINNQKEGGQLELNIARQSRINAAARERLAGNISGGQLDRTRSSITQGSLEEEIALIRQSANDRRNAAVNELTEQQVRSAEALLGGTRLLEASVIQINNALTDLDTRDAEGKPVDADVRNALQGLTQARQEDFDALGLEEQLINEQQNNIHEISQRQLRDYKQGIEDQLRQTARSMEDYMMSMADQLHSVKQDLESARVEGSILRAKSHVLDNVKSLSDPIIQVFDLISSAIQEIIGIGQDTSNKLRDLSKKPFEINRAREDRALERRNLQQSIQDSTEDLLGISSPVAIRGEKGSFNAEEFLNSAGIKTYSANLDQFIETSNKALVQATKTAGDISVFNVGSTVQEEIRRQQRGTPAPGAAIAARYTQLQQAQASGQSLSAEQTKEAIALWGTLHGNIDGIARASNLTSDQVKEFANSVGQADQNVNTFGSSLLESLQLDINEGKLRAAEDQILAAVSSLANETRSLQEIKIDNVFRRLELDLKQVAKQLRQAARELPLAIMDFNSGMRDFRQAGLPMTLGEQQTVARQQIDRDFLAQQNQYEELQERIAEFASFTDEDSKLNARKTAEDLVKENLVGSNQERGLLLVNDIFNTVGKISEEKLAKFKDLFDIPEVTEGDRRTAQYNNSEVFRRRFRDGEIDFAQGGMDVVGEKNNSPFVSGSFFAQSRAAKTERDFLKQTQLARLEQYVEQMEQLGISTSKATSRFYELDNAKLENLGVQINSVGTALLEGVRANVESSLTELFKFDKDAGSILVQFGESMRDLFAKLAAKIITDFAMAKIGDLFGLKNQDGGRPDNPFMGGVLTGGMNADPAAGLGADEMGDVQTHALLQQDLSIQQQNLAVNQQILTAITTEGLGGEGGLLGDKDKEAFTAMGEGMFSGSYGTEGFGAKVSGLGITSSESLGLSGDPLAGFDLSEAAGTITHSVNDFAETSGQSFASGAGAIAGAVGAIPGILNSFKNGDTAGGILGILGTGFSLLSSFGLFADGGTAGKQQAGVEGLLEGLQREQRLSGGKKAGIAFLHEGEEVITTKNGEAQDYREMKASGVYDALRKGKANFANGGTYGAAGSAMRQAAMDKAHGNAAPVNYYGGDVNIARVEDYESFRRSHAQLRTKQNEEDRRAQKTRLT